MSAHFNDRVVSVERSVHLGREVRKATPEARGYARLGKRALDIFLVILALPAVLPVVLLLMCLVSLDGKPPIYRQERIGKGGRVFKIWKLRTMVWDAKDQLDRHLALNPEAKLEWDTYQKLSDDPRITRIGHFLRQSSLDELPQLVNVLRGDMSLVGPRPMMPEQRPLYPGNAYYVVRPGLTGLWQVSDRNASTFAQRADFDAKYVLSCSFKLDLKILFATVGVVMRGTGK